MTNEITRRELFKRTAIALPAGITLLATEACTTAQADQFVTLLNTVVTGVETLLPIVELLAPPPYGAALVDASTFLNLVQVAAGQTAQELAVATDSNATQAQKILGFWTTAFLDPSVLGRLPATVTTASGATLSVASLTKTLVTDVNGLLTALAHTAGGTATSVTNNAIVSIQVPAAIKFPILGKHEKGKPFDLNKDQLKKLVAILAKSQSNLAGLHKPRTFQTTVR
jgi:hypothetical protein